MINGRYEVVKQLIELYEQYEDEDKNPDLLSFVQWISDKYDSESEMMKQRAWERSPKQHLPAIPVYKTMGVRARFLEDIAEIARYHDFYTRKALKDIEINSRMEYLFLQTVELLGQTKKTDLINIFHTEYTTGMDNIRRLFKSGLLNETTNENDKRSRLLEITDKGRGVLKQANKNMEEEARMFLAIASDNKWKKAMFVLEEINDFHRFVYENHGNKPFAEIGNMIDSLKYLYRL